ncbi:MAG: threonine synthase [Bacteroidetes bacterium QS_8_68_15]|nr:MAG: threonine synthase [Bacteroidetes bacterium QS_8_68_15]
MPHFTSTRGDAASVSFEDALLRGLAPDGGLFVPETIPSLAPAGEEDDSFPERSARVLTPWLADEIASEALRAITADALDFPVPLVPLAEGRDSGLGSVHVLELFHGPTLSFKDVGARVMARCMAHFMKGRNDKLTILVATSGDTGSAVADGFAGQPGVEVVLLFPEGQVSPVQERQLVAQRPGVQALAVDGPFDDCQRLVKEAFQDEELSSALLLSSANSINVGRLLPQMLYYVWAAEQFDEEVLFCVPSGNLGNLTAGVLAARSGLPVRRFLAAHNTNDFFPRFLEGGPNEFAESERTLSNAMDVGAPSNFERLHGLLSEEELRATIWGASVSDEATLQAMRRVYDATGYVADPHTAVGLEAVRRYRRATGGEKTPAVVLSTAHPAKFPAVVEDALGFEPDAPDRLAALWGEDPYSEPLAPTLEALRGKLLP